MSERKQVIHVKDLVIKADNVIVEGTHQRRRDPFFGRYMEDRGRDDSQGVQDEEQTPQEDDEDDLDSERRFERRPFSWF